MKKNIAIILILISLFLVPTLSHGELREGSIEISPFIGYCTGATARELCHKDIYGVRLGYFITSAWEMEGAFERVGSDAATMFHADALYHFMPEKSFNPFIIGGVGGAHVKRTRGNSYDTLMADIGVGFKYQLSENIAFRTEIRDVITHFQNAFVTAGLTYTFGKKPSKSVGAAPAPASDSQPAPEKKEEPMKPVQEPVAEPVPQPTPEPKVEPMPAPVPVAEPVPQPTPEPVKSVLEDIYFEFNESIFTKNVEQTLEKNIEFIKANPDVKIRIEGYSCAHGNAKYNMKLSKKRANKVKEYLIKHGVPARRLTAVGYGKTRLSMPEIPTKENKNSVEARANRRVHFEVIDK